MFAQDEGGVADWSCPPQARHGYAEAQRESSMSWMALQCHNIVVEPCSFTERWQNASPSQLCHAERAFGGNSTSTLILPNNKWTKLLLVLIAELSLNKVACRQLS